jgi:hypothetical protein
LHCSLTILVCLLLNATWSLYPQTLDHHKVNVLSPLWIKLHHSHLRKKDLYQTISPVLIETLTSYLTAGPFIFFEYHFLSITRQSVPSMDVTQVMLVYALMNRLSRRIYYFASRSAIFATKYQDHFRNVVWHCQPTRAQCLRQLLVSYKGWTVSLNELINHQINCQRLVGTTLLRGDKRGHVLLKGGDVEETCLGGISVKWQNCTDRYIDTSTYRIPDR